MPPTMIGVPSSLFSGRGPRLSVLKRQATSSLLKLLASIWSSGEYLLPRRSAVYIGHSPFFVLGMAAGAVDRALDWPAVTPAGLWPGEPTTLAERQAKAAAMRARGTPKRSNARFMGISWMTWRD